MLKILHFSKAVIQRHASIIYLWERSVHYEPNINEALDKKQKDIIRRFNITKEDCELNNGIFHVHPQTLEHHGLVLLEGGFTRLSASLIVNYVKIVKKNIKLLKLHEYIQPESSVVNSFLYHAGNPPLENLDVGHNNEDGKKFIEVYNKVLISYLAWRLETTENGIEKILKVYPRIKHRSFKLLSWTLDILEHKLDFTKDKIRRHGYLIHSYPYNTLDTLKRVPILGGKDIKEVFHAHPKIIMSSTDTILATAQHLKEYGISDKSAQLCYEIFTLGSDSIKIRLDKMRKIPEFLPFADNRRVLEIVHYQRKASDRLAKLRQLQRNCVSLHLLVCNEGKFEQFTREGVDRTRGNETVSLLATNLGHQEPKIREYLGRHPYWCSVSILSVQKTLKLLMDKGFSKEDIYTNLHLVLYPSEQVEEILMKMPESEEIAEAKSIVEACSPTKKEVALTKSSELAMCLYFLEKDHHFSGNGVWRKTQ